jgi:proteasome lid subunit RPN8/RPN11
VDLAIVIIGLLNAPFNFRGAAGDPNLLAGFRNLAALAIQGGQQADNREVAAFLVRESNGTITFRVWPHTARTRSETYHGPTPSGTVAIAHTHPFYAPQPSRGDIKQSVRLGLPIYVITYWDLSVVDPSSGEWTYLIHYKAWMKSPKPAEAEASRSSGSPDRP